jgi:hypothetical protein
MGMGWEFFPKQLSAESAQRELDFNGLRAQWQAKGILLRTLMEMLVFPGLAEDANLPYAVQFEGFDG